MAGIYIHIPFCKQKCHYCNFFSIASLKNKDRFLEVLKKEISLQKDFLKEEEVSTVYFGGGTPSVLSISELTDIFEELNKYHIINENAEITLEANPDDLSKSQISKLRKSFINRLSIGVQSFFDDDLHYLNRVHNTEEAQKSIKLAQDSSFSNMNIDLIYGIPGLSTNKWNENLNIFFDLDIPHLSAYSLTVEPKTALDLLIKKKKLENISEQQSIQHFNALIQQTEAKDFIHYEISNFSKEGFYSKHNSLYWLGGNYLGLGPSAHSFNGYSRQWNVSNLSKYNTMEILDSSICEKEVLDTKQRFNEYIMTSLRTSWGCDLEHINSVFGQKYLSYLERSAEKYIQDNQIIRLKNKYILSHSGKLFADGIASDLFLD